MPNYRKSEELTSHQGAGVFGHRFSGAPEEFSRIYVKDIGQFLGDLQSNVSHRPLDAAQIDTIDLGITGEPLLGQFPLMAEAT